MTEAEAANKWCPLVRTGAFGNSCAVNIWPSNGEIIHGACIASKCMLWRWTVRTIPERDVMGKPILSERVGYCGAAGPLSRD